jgi:hypothetical protein
MFYPDNARVKPKTAMRFLKTARGRTDRVDMCGALFAPAPPAAALAERQPSVSTAARLVERGLRESTMSDTFTAARRRVTSSNRIFTLRRVPCLAALLLVPIGLGAQINVFTNRYDQARTGANLTETILTVANVNAARFGKLYSYPVDGTVYAQPLYASGLTINGAVHNVLFVATMNDKVYAFDADSRSATPLWTTDFTNPPSVTPVAMTDILPTNPGNIIGNVGIQGTPVIDPAAHTVYLVARTKESGNYVQRLHALDITTGRERSGSPVTITGSVPGTSGDSTVVGNTRVITFDPKVHVQRPGLALTNGVVLVAWAAHEDITPSHGWIMGFDASTLARVGIFAVIQDGYLGGIWQGGRAPAIDAVGNAYFATGNGQWDGSRNFGDSLLKFQVARTGMTLLDYFTPGNEATLNSNDYDLSGSGFTLLPETSLLLGGGKEGVLYLIDATKLGHKVTNDTQIVEKIPVNGGHVMGGPVYWNSASAGPLVYNWSEKDVLLAYRFSNGKLVTPPYAAGHVLSPGHPGGSLTVSAHGSASNTGIIWAAMPTSQDLKHIVGAGILRAFNAETLAEIWNSDQVASRDRLGDLMKFVPPVVANGRVYLPNHDNAVNVYGLLPSDFSINVSPASQTASPGALSVNYAVAVTAQAGFAGQVSLAASGGPSGTTIALAPELLDSAGTSKMTVTVPAGAPTGTFKLTVTATSGTRVHTATPSIVVVAASTPAGAIGIDFVGTSTSTMAASEQAGVVVQSHWNSAVGAVRTSALALVDGNGAATGAGLTWTSHNGWQTPIADAPGNARMMKGYVDTTSTSTTTVNVTGLPPRAYDVYVYVDGANGTSERSGAYTISGAGITTKTITAVDAASTDFSTTFTQAIDSAGSYVKFTITACGFTLTAAPSAAATTTRRAPVNGIQIVPIGSTPTGAGTVVLWASLVQAADVHGNWQLQTDTTAAGNATLFNHDLAAAKIAPALAAPANYFETTFQATSGVPYHLWVRLRAQNNSSSNDSVHVQFNDAVDEVGTATLRIGTTSSAEVVLQNGPNGAPDQGWGWADNGWGVLGQNIYFASSGTHTLRVQQREDGASVDQIVLSPDEYLTLAPGPRHDDTTILSATSSSCAVTSSPTSIFVAPSLSTWPIPVYPNVPMDRATQRLGFWP